MDEGDLEAEQALPRLCVDQFGALGGEPIELGLHVVDLVGDVVHARTAGGEELGDRSLVTERRKQLDASGADEHGCRLDPLAIDVRAMFQLGAEKTLVRVDRLVQVVNGDAEVVDAAGLHGSDATGLVFDRPDGTDGLRGPGLGLDRAEQLLQLVARERLALEQLPGEPVE